MKSARHLPAVLSLALCLPACQHYSINDAPPVDLEVERAGLFSLITTQARDGASAVVLGGDGPVETVRSGFLLGIYYLYASCDVQTVSVDIDKAVVDGRRESVFSFAESAVSDSAYVQQARLLCDRLDPGGFAGSGLVEGVAFAAFDPAAQERLFAFGTGQEAHECARDAEDAGLDRIQFPAWGPSLRHQRTFDGETVVFTGFFIHPDAGAEACRPIP